MEAVQKEAMIVQDLWRIAFLVLPVFQSLPS